MASRLAPCPSCARHVKVGSGSCPFCGGDVPNAPPRGVTLAAGRPLTRAALMFAGVSLVAGCSGEVRGSAEVDAGGTTVDPGRGEPSPESPAKETPTGDDAGRTPPALSPVDAAPVRALPVDAASVEDAAHVKVLAEDAAPVRPRSVDAGTSDDASVVTHSEDASPWGPHCGAGPAAYGVFALPDACP